ncbi:transglycosylase SLT domain-containing protein [Mesorhizobium sp. BR1-1-16]|uniref:transglycosylase SLT domain-containing protein n=1 Tax=Mesorhizobium sp. BR1-1-16 TaxID=2876653 RepID=UPI001CC92083|nr:transglycosylase SLT domain-containing protein [Mesorhizobium sp. BR1-1-16]MBZ9937581.1 transglycosylase SLT domain-containing protein [Mesorhizobium sp. BR1-1-16]
MPSVNEKASGKEVAGRIVRRLVVVTAALASLTVGAAALNRSSAPYPDESQKAQIDRLIVFYSKKYNVPVSLAREVVRSESEYRPLARNGPYWGLMQIRYDTAQGMGYRGSAKGLLDAETNLAFGIAYLANALKAADGNMSRGHMLYRKGYYYEAKRKRVLDEMILVRDFRPVGEAPTLLAMADAQDGTGALWSGEAVPGPATSASAAIAEAVAAPIPREKPVVETVVAEAVPTPMTAPVPVAAPAVVGPAVAHPTVVYASVLPFAKSQPLAKPLSPTPIVAPGLVPDSPAADQPEVTAKADGAVPMPRPKPVTAAASVPADAVEPPKSKLEIALLAAAAKKGAELAAAKAAANPAPVAAAEAAPVVIASTALRGNEAAAAPVRVAARHDAVPMPRARPVVSE